MKLTHAVAPVALVLSAACTTETTEPQIANPAATYCIEQGGAYALGADGAGGTCTLADGQVVDAWEYFRANAPSE